MKNRLSLNDCFLYVHRAYFGGHYLDDTAGQAVGLILCCCFIVWGHCAKDMS